MSDRLAHFFLFFPIFLFSLSFHEASHAWMANRLGDPTARMMGRLSLNPLAHIDWIGTVVFPMLMFLMPGLLLFGWAKPVPVDARNLRGGIRGNMKVAAAGPVSNILLAGLFAGLVHLVVQLPVAPGLSVAIIIQMFETGVYLNLMLAAFNLIPIPPLDGSQVLAGLLTPSQRETLYNLGRYGALILLAALYLGVLRFLTIPVFWLADWILPS